MGKELILERIAGGFNFPTSLAFDGGGTAFIAKSGLAFGDAEPGGRIWSVKTPSGERRELVAGLNPPVNGLTYDSGTLIISALGEISRLRLNDGERTVILDDLPSGGNYHTNMAVVGPDGWLYFSQGAMTNSGIVGLDALELCWLRRLPHEHDLPGYEIVLRGLNVETVDPLNDDPTVTTRTGAFVPFGNPGEAGRVIPAHLPCTAAVMRCRPDGRDLELVAWGLRNAFGLGFLPDGRLLAIDQGADDRGSRPLGNVPDLLFEIRPHAWYGWPDFIGDDPVTNPDYQPERGPAPAFLLSNHDQLARPRGPLYRFQPHVAAAKFDVGPRGSVAWSGALAIALFGDERPMTGPPGPRMGRSVVRFDLATRELSPALKGELERPIDVRFNPRDGDLYILDFGHFEMNAEGGMKATAGTGALWRVIPNEGSL